MENLFRISIKKFILITRFSDVDNTQVLHWLVGNIPDGADLSKGEEMVPYIQPIPVKGTGYHRIAFVLFRHKKKIDFSHFKLKRYISQHRRNLVQI